MISQEQFLKTKGFIYRNGRLLERKLFEYFFENGSKQACINALAAYQNEDGGFGNGIEPDLLCSQSTAIGAESALYILDLLDEPVTEIIELLVNWIEKEQNLNGVIPHPPEGLLNYPHQPWWQNSDNDRILVITGLLEKLGVNKPKIAGKTRTYYKNKEIPSPEDFYGYPMFVYLKFCQTEKEDITKFKIIQKGIPQLLDKHEDHFPLFSRYWYYAKDSISPEIVQNQACNFVKAIKSDGGLEIAYSDLPWWRPIFTLDGLILMKKWGILG